MKTRRAAVVVLAQGALIALRASVAWNLEALTYSAAPARHETFDAGRVTIDGRSNAVRSQVVTMLQDIVEYDPDALEDVINAYNDTMEDLMTLECA